MKINKFGMFLLAAFVSLNVHFVCFGQGNGNGKPGQDEYVSDEVLIKFKDGVAKSVMDRIKKAVGIISSRNGYGNHYQVAKIKKGKVQGVLKKCSKYTEIEYAEPNHIYRINMTPDDEFFSFQWHLPLIHIEEAWDISTGEGVTVAVVDTGVNPDGPDGFGGRLILGRNFVKRREESRDDNGHGTFVAGTIAQETNNGIGVSGVAPDATILAVKAFDKHGASRTDSIVDAIRWAANHGAQVINMSFGGAPFNETLKRVINRMRFRGVVFVASAGNGGRPEIPFPAAYDGVISVGAISLDKTRASYSNHGPDLDIVAPGGLVTKDQNDDNNADGVLQETLFTDLLKSPEPIWNFYFLEGTSFSAPHVSGVVALLLAKNPNLTPDEVLNILINTTDDLGEPGRDDEFGWGLVNAAEALKFDEESE